MPEKDILDPRSYDPVEDYAQGMAEDAIARQVQCTVIAGHLAKEYGILVSPTVVEYVLSVAEHLEYIPEWVSWQET